jgi:hypothetical protein
MSMIDTTEYRAAYGSDLSEIFEALPPGLSRALDEGFVERDEPGAGRPTA